MTGDGAASPGGDDGIDAAGGDGGGTTGEDAGIRMLDGAGDWEGKGAKRGLREENSVVRCVKSQTIASLIAAIGHSVSQWRSGKRMLSRVVALESCSP